MEKLFPVHSCELPMNNHLTRRWYNLSSKIYRVYSQIKKSNSRFSRSILTYFQAKIKVLVLKLSDFPGFCYKSKQRFRESKLEAIYENYSALNHILHFIIEACPIQQSFQHVYVITTKCIFGIIPKGPLGAVEILPPKYYDFPGFQGFISIFKVFFKVLQI